MIIVEIAGFLGADPEERFTATGKRVISLRVAAKVRHSGQDETIWWRVSIWGDRFDKMLPYLKKGSSVIIIGEMGKTETYVAKDDSTQLSHNLTAEILKFSPFGRPESTTERAGPAAASMTGSQAGCMQEQQQTAFGAGAEPEHAFAGDDLPFLKLMLFSAVSELSKRKDAELIVLPFWQGPKKAKAAAVLESFSSLVQSPIDAKDFVGKAGETLLLYSSKGKERRCLLVGLGKEENLTVDGLRQTFSNVAKECQKRAISKINLVLPTIAELRHINAKQCLKGVAEGILLTNYCWEKLATLDEKTVLLESVMLVGIIPSMLEIVHACEKIVEGVYFARDLINGNADDVTPSYLGQITKNIASKFPSTTAHVYDRKWIEKEKMGLLAAVARGSFNEPAFIILSYKGHPQSKDHTVIVGKGVTYDTGGLNLKATGSMETMRDDMSGAATALATIATAASLNLKHNVTAVVPSTENAIDAKSFKPGDVYVGFSGMSVEIGNTDAEGRLILADALSYSVKKLKPTRLIDLATLTGAMVVALGEGIAGLFSNNDTLSKQLLDASDQTAEKLWRMPLHAPYKELLKSDIADIRNIGGRPGSSILAALFLQEFVKDLPWAHLDIAGTAFGSKERGYNPKNGVGFGVRLLIDFLQNFS